jgi:hypothetical protein
MEDLSHLVPDGAAALVPTGQQSDGVTSRDRAMSAPGGWPAADGWSRVVDPPLPVEVEETELGDGARHTERGES